MEMLENEQFGQLTNDPENNLNERRLSQQRDSLLLFLAAELYGYEWVQQYYPAFYEHCLKSI